MDSACSSMYGRGSYDSGQRGHFVKEASQDHIRGLENRIRNEVVRDITQDTLARAGILHVWIAVRPVPTWMQRVPWRAQIRTRLRIVTVLPETVADVDFIVPNRLEQMNEIVLGGYLPSRLDN